MEGQDTAQYFKVNLTEWKSVLKITLFLFTFLLLSIGAAGAVLQSGWLGKGRQITLPLHATFFFFFFLLSIFKFRAIFFVGGESIF